MVFSEENRLKNKSNFERKNILNLKEKKDAF